MAKDANGNEIPAVAPAAPATPAADGAIPKARLDEVIGERNDLRKQMELQGKTLAELQASIKVKEDASLAEQGKFKDLYEKEKSERQKALLEISNAKVYQEKVKALVDVELTAMPDNLKDLIPSGDPLFQLDYIAKLKSKPELWGEKKPFASGQKPAQSAAASDDEVTTLKKLYQSLDGKQDRNSQDTRIAIKNKLALLGQTIY